MNNIEDILRGIIREELERALALKPTEVPVVIPHVEPVEMVEETPVIQTIEIHNNAQLMAAIKEMCDKPGMAAQAKKILSENTDYPKFSSVPDENCQNVYNLVSDSM